MSSLRLLGTFNHTLDAQRRVSVPSAWRKQLGEAELVLARKEGGYLQINLADELYARLEALRSDETFFDDEAQENIALYLSDMHQCGQDKQGRIPLPADFLAHAGISGELVLIGTHNSIQIWSPERWAAKKSSKGGSAATALKALAKRNSAEGTIKKFFEIGNKGDGNE